MGPGIILYVLLAMFWNFFKVAASISIPVGIIVFLAFRFLFLRHSQKHRRLGLPIAFGITVLIFGVLIFGQLVPIFFILKINSSSPNLVGTWVPSDDTLSYMQQLGYKFLSHNIEFKSDGTFVMVNIPNEWIFPQKPNNMDFYSGKGTWTLSDQPTANMGNIQPIVNLSNPSGDILTIRFGSVFDKLYFYPDNIPTDINRILFQKCPPYLHITDPILEPVIKALKESKRDSFGFSQISSKDRIEIDGAIGNADIWLHVYNDFSSHDIFFRFRNDKYVWVFEQENYTGPEKWVDSDAATWEETITLQYQIEDINGGPVNGLMVDYIGHNPRLINMSNNWYLTNNINDVLPILEEWRQWRANQPPSPQSLCP
jgi:hypothetical protein